MDKKELKHHAERLEKAIEQLKQLDDAVFEKAREQHLRMDFVRKWQLAPRSKKEKAMPAICLIGASIAQGKHSAVGKLEKELQHTLRNLERLL